MKKLILSLLMLFAFNTTNAQSPLIPYRLGKLWGLADTTGTIKLTPAYDAIELDQVKRVGSKESIPFFITQKNKKYGLLQGTSTILTAKHYRLFIDSVFIQENRQIENNHTVGGSRTIVRNLKGTVLFPDSIMEITPVKYSKQPQMMMFVTFGKNCSGAFLYDHKKQVITQWFFQKMAYVYLSDQQGRLYATVGAAEKSKPSFYELIYNIATNKFDIKQLAALPETRGGTGDALYKARNMEYGGVSGNKGNNLMFEKKFIKTRDGWSQVTITMRYREKGVKSDTIKLSLQADSIMLTDFSSGRFGQYHTTDSYWTKATDTIYTYQNYLRYTKNGKKGVFVEGKPVPALYNDLIYFKSSAAGKPIFLAAQISDKDHKTYWGVIDAQGREVQPVIYDEIIRSNGSGPMWVLKKGNLYGIADNEGKIVFPVKYDKIVPEESFLSFSIIHQGKFGYLDMYKNRIEPKFPYAVNRKLPMTNGYAVFELKDSGGKVLGFADPKGFLYFKNQ
ncbi:hypothetical protein HDC92_002710 [Pedobacter sp. AK017]|uniref:WG repeat-containing protein n=1 Tax=Pedobacter sp. AK017 TaxID=2723073 RepID=UPI0016194803|nr:WG repeat-containing protein [Pedobacter sp. AK017]MBB5439026.1 hypothetical protein [Pedobacter sp. AK017]